jgi:hypothetical protein
MSTLRSALADLTAKFTDGILDAIRSASLDELMGEKTGNWPPAGARRRRGPAPTRAMRAATATMSGRLPRRSAEDIAALLDQVIGAVKKQKEGMRAEPIRESLGLEAKEMPRVLKEGLATKKLKSKGQKRATTYFAT